MEKQKIDARSEALAIALLENQCDIIEIRSFSEEKNLLTHLSSLTKKFDLPTLSELSLNEKVGYEVAFTASISSKRASVVLGRNGLAFAMDPLMSSVYTGVLGGFLILVTDEPGTPLGGVQDSRTVGIFAKLPVLDPSSFEEMGAMVKEGFALSEKFQIPVLVRLHPDLTHQKEKLPSGPLHSWSREGLFLKNAQRWAATPRFRYLLHRDLNKKLKEIGEFFENQGESLSAFPKRITQTRLGIISCGATHPLVESVLSEMGLLEQIPVLKVGSPHPLPKKRVEGFASEFNETLVIENPLPAIEIQMDHRKKIMGKLNEVVPFKEKFTREDMVTLLSSAVTRVGLAPSLPLPQAKPSTSAAPKPFPKENTATSYRSLIDRIRKAFPKAVLTGDRTPFGLALGLDRFDCALDTSSSITLASGIYQALHQDGEPSSIIAVTEADAFFHSGMSPLVNAVYNQAKFLLVILDGKNKKDQIVHLVQGCGIPNCETTSCRNSSLLIKKMKQAFEQRDRKEEDISVFVVD